MVDIEEIKKDLKELNLDKGYLYICGSFECCFHSDDLEIILMERGLLRNSSKYYYDGYSKTYLKDNYLQVWIEKDDSLDDKRS